MGSSHGLEFYVSEIRSVPLLTAKEERDLARRIIRENDPRAREQLVRGNLRLVVKLARNYVNRGLSLEDLVEEGNVGLLKAVERFNPEMNIRFSTYAAWWIRQAFKRALQKYVPRVHVPGHMMEWIARWKRVAAELEKESLRPARQEEIVGRMKLSKARARMIGRAMEALRSRSNAADSMGEDMDMQTLLEDRHTPPPEEVARNRDQLGLITGLLKLIERREALVIRLRFGLDGEVPLTLSQIGQRINLTRERVRQVETEGLQKLNRYLSTCRAEKE